MSQAMVIDGRLLASEIETDLTAKVAEFRKKTGRAPALATVIVGENPASVTYVRMKGNACARIGMDSVKVSLPEETATGQLIDRINRLNEDPNVDGILLQHPVPAHIDEQACFNAISMKKDSDGVNTASFGAMAMGLECFKGATPLSIMALIKRFGIETTGREAVVIGRSAILGKPAAMLLLAADATVTVCHSRTRNLPDVVRRADIVVAAVGKPRFVQAEWIKPGAVLIDAGYNPGNIGDIDLENAAPLSSAYTPVPGGVGPVTIMKLLEQTVSAAFANL